MTHVLKSSILAVSCAAIVANFAATASGGLITLDLDTIFSGKDSPDGPSPWLSVAFEDVAPGEVEMTFTSLLTSPDALKGKALYLNFDPSLTLSMLNFDYIAAGSTVAATAINVNENGFKADGTGGDFDILFDYKDDNFLPGSVSKYLISSVEAGFSALSFAFLSDDSSDNSGLGYYAASHVQQTTTGEGSTWIGSTAIVGEGPTVPEPGTFALLALGAVGLGGYARRRRA